MMNYLLRTDWWKLLGVGILIYVIIAGFLMPAPALNILNETIRCLHFHVPMWFGMVFLLLVGLCNSILYLRTFQLKYDLYATSFNVIAIVYGILGLTTGMIWANYTWGEPWSNDPKQAASAIALLMYLAYFVLRGAIADEDKRAKVASVYNIITFFIYNALIFVIPRLTASLHPGNGGNPALSGADRDSTLTMVFYPAVIGFIILGIWMATLHTRTAIVEQKRLGLWE